MPLSAALMIEEILGKNFVSMYVNEPCGRQWLVHRSNRYVIVCDIGGRSHLVMDTSENRAYRQLTTAYRAVLAGALPGDQHPT